jgi:hypothetical protein
MKYNDGADMPALVNHKPQVAEDWLGDHAGLRCGMKADHVSVFSPACV